MAEQARGQGLQRAGRAGSARGFVTVRARGVPRRRRLQSSALWRMGLGVVGGVAAASAAQGAKRAPQRGPDPPYEPHSRYTRPASTPASRVARRSERSETTRRCAVSTRTSSFNLASSAPRVADSFACCSRSRRQGGLAARRSPRGPGRGRRRRLRPPQLDAGRVELEPQLAGAPARVRPRAPAARSSSCPPPRRAGRAARSTSAPARACSHGLRVWVPRWRDHIRMPRPHGCCAIRRAARLLIAALPGAWRSPSPGRRRSWRARRRSRRPAACAW